MTDTVAIRRWHDARMAGPTHVLFDFFGTLVDYSASRTEQGYHGSYGIVRRMGADVTYAGFLDAWTRVCAEHDRRCDADDREYSMMDVGADFLREMVGHDPADADLDAFVDRYVAEWSTGVRYRPDIVAMVGGLADTYRLAVVTNTHHAPLVPAHLTAMGLAGAFDAVVTSVEVGWRKPHARIYRAALDSLGIAVGDAVFVGDTYLPDFVGPRRLGMRAYLIDADNATSVPPENRLASILELPDRLGHGR
jgi:putative hydrolase of the HAD superfamily